MKQGGWIQDHYYHLIYKLGYWNYFEVIWQVWFFYFENYKGSDFEFLGINLFLMNKLMVNFS
jgi:hypothetical protein